MIDAPHSFTELEADEPPLPNVHSFEYSISQLRSVADASRLHSRDLSVVLCNLKSSTSAAISQIEGRVQTRQIPGAVALADSADTARTALQIFSQSISLLSEKKQRNRAHADDALSELRLAVQQINQFAKDLALHPNANWKNPPHLSDFHLSFTGASSCSRPTVNLDSVSLSHTLSRWRASLQIVLHCIAQLRVFRETQVHAEQQLVRSLRDTHLGVILAHTNAQTVDQKYAVAGAFAGQIWGSTIALPTVAKVLSPVNKKLLTQMLDGKSVRAFWDDPPKPEHVTKVWASFTPTQQQTLLVQRPDIIGNLPGISAKDRDSANRLQLQRLSMRSSQLTTDQLRLVISLNNLLQHSQYASETQDAPTMFLLSLNSTSAMPLASIGYGNIDTAEQVTMVVGGMHSDAPSTLSEAADTASLLFRAQHEITKVSETHAVVAWLGYDSPHLVSVLGSQAALDGAPRLIAELNALQSGASGEAASRQVHVVAHSYGTTLSSIALTRVSTPVASFTMFGSAGIDSTLVNDLFSVRVAEITPGQQAIYTAVASGDIVAPIGALLSDRSLPQGTLNEIPGALQFSVNGDPDQNLADTNGHGLRGTSQIPFTQAFNAEPGHGYLDAGTQSLHTVAQITTGTLSVSAMSKMCRVTEQPLFARPHVRKTSLRHAEKSLPPGITQVCDH